MSQVEKKAKQVLKDLQEKKDPSRVHVIEIKDGSLESPWEFVGSCYELFQAFLEEREPNTVGKISCGCVGMPFETLIGTKKSMRKKMKQDMLKKLKDAASKEDACEEKEKEEEHEDFLSSS